MADHPARGDWSNSGTIAGYGDIVVDAVHRLSPLAATAQGGAPA